MSDGLSVRNAQENLHACSQDGDVDQGRSPGLAERAWRAASDAVDNLPNAFPPRQTPVPQPDDPQARRQMTGFFTDMTLCIGCKACEVACKQWNQLPGDGLTFTGHSYDNTGHLSATTWRHVSFKEKIARLPDGTSNGYLRGGEDAAGAYDEQAASGGHDLSRWLMLSDVCKHCEQAPCQHSCPTGAIIYNQFGNVYLQNDICNGCGYCVSACPFGVLGRADSIDPHSETPGDGHAHKCTLCMDRQTDGEMPACAKACPTASIRFGALDDLRELARRRVADLQERGNQRAWLYGCDSLGDYGPLSAFFLLEDHPNEYNLPEHPPQPFQKQGWRYGASLLMTAALSASAAAIFALTAGGNGRE